MFEAYKIGITIGLTNKASQGLSLIRKDLLAAHGITVDLQKKLNGLKWIGAGGLAAGAGVGILSVMKKSVEYSKEYTRQISLMNASGMTHVEVAQSIAAAWKTSGQVITSSAQENLEAIRELRSVFGKGKGMDEAYAVLPMVQRTKAIMEALTGQEQHGIANAMVKTAELRAPGMVTTDVLNRNAELMTKALTAFGGTLSVQDFLGTMKMGKMATLGLSDDFVYKYMPTLMQEMKTRGGGGAQSAGTYIATAYRAIVTGAGIKKSALPLWEQMGLVNPADVVKNSTGSMQLKPGAVKDSALFQSNPEQWAVKVLGPAIATYTASHPNLNREQLIGGMFGDRNAQFLMNTFIAKSSQFERDKSLIETSGSTYSTYQKLLQTNPQLAETAMHKQWTNVMAQLGYTVLPTLIPLMVKFANGLNSLSQWMKEHPMRLKIVVHELMFFGAALTALGTAAMVVGSMKILGITQLISKLPLLSSGFMALGGTASAAAIPIAALIAALGGAAALYLYHKDVSSWADKQMHGNGDAARREKYLADIAARDSQSPFLAPGGSKTIQVNTSLNMDGRQVASVVTKHQADAFNRPASSGSSYDLRFGFVPSASYP